MKQTGCSWETFRGRRSWFCLFCQGGIGSDWNCARVVVDWCCEWRLVVGTVPDRSWVWNGACVDFFFLARDNPPASSLVFRLPFCFAHARPSRLRLSSAEGCRSCQPSTAVVWVQVTPPEEWIRQGVKKRRGGESGGKLKGC